MFHSNPNTPTYNSRGNILKDRLLVGYTENRNTILKSIIIVNDHPGGWIHCLGHRERIHLDLIYCCVTKHDAN